MSSLFSLRYLRFLLDGVTSFLLILVGRFLPNLKIPPVDLTNKTALITGANSGIGFSLALSLAKQNATVYLACRNPLKAAEAASKIIEACGGGSDASSRIHICSLDTSSLKSVRAFAETWNSKPIDLLLNNAGITGPPGNQHTTSEGLGTIYATNFAGSFLLTSLLEANLTPTARVVFTSSTVQWAARTHRIFTLPLLAPHQDPKTNKPTDSGFYADTKFMQSAFAHLLQKRFDSVPGNRRTAHAFVPGYTYTPIFDKTPQTTYWRDPFFWSLKACTAICIPVDQGAAGGLWVATTDDERVVGEGKGGETWDRCVKRSTAVDILPERTLEKMWRQWEVDAGAEWA